MINKIGIVGGGNIGGVAASEIVSRGMARNVALVLSGQPPLFCLTFPEVDLPDQVSFHIDRIHNTQIAVKDNNSRLLTIWSALRLEPQPVFGGIAAYGIDGM